jgi:hypothetical protein
VEEPVTGMLVAGEDLFQDGGPQERQELRRASDLPMAQRLTWNRWPLFLIGMCKRSAFSSLKLIIMEKGEMLQEE